MMKSLLRLLQATVLLGVSGLASAQVDLRDGHPDVYYVQQGDNLWNIASQFLDSPWQWPELWHVNQEIENPHLIYPGDVIRLVYVDGQPRLQLERPGQDTQTASSDDQPTVRLMQDGTTIRLTPQARELPLEAAIPTIPLERIENYLIQVEVLTRSEIRESPYVIGGQDGRVVFGDNDNIYARDPFTEWEDLAPGYGVFRVGEEYVDPDTEEVLGYEAIRVGLGRVSDHEGETITLRVMSSSQGIRSGDRLLSSRERKMESIFMPSPPDEEVEAKIIRFFDRLASVAKNDVVVLNKGTTDGLRPGHVLEVRQSGQVVRDRVQDELVQLPSVKAGTILIFRTFENVSYGLVVDSRLPINMHDVATNPADPF